MSDNPLDKVDPDVRNLIEEALENRSAAKKRKSDSDEVHIGISSIMGEFMDTYIVLGFDTNGQPVRIAHSKSPMESYGLGSLLNSFQRDFHNAMHDSKRNVNRDIEE